MKTIGLILLAIIRFAVALFVGVFLFLIKVAMSWR